MLRRLTLAEVTENIERIYRATMDPARAGYPIYSDGIKTRADLEETIGKSFRLDTWEMLAFEKNGTVSGWIEFFFIPEDKYLQTVVFSIEEDTETALAEFTEYCQSKFTGYTLYLGFPGENQSAVSFLQENGWTCGERLWNNVLCLDQHQLCPEGKETREVDYENFADFRLIHDQIQDAYWNSNRLFQSLNEWRIFVYYQGGLPKGVIFFQSDSKISEIFGVEFADGVFEEEICSALLIKAMNECKRGGQRYLCYFGDNDKQTAALKAGFRCVGEYILYIKTV